MSAAPELAVVIPTRDRATVLAETLRRLAETAAEEPIEVVVVDDGSTDDTVARLQAMVASMPWPLTVERQEGRGPASARNAGMRAATAPVCLFTGDDSRPVPGAIRRHIDFHGRDPAPSSALLGRVWPAPPLDRSEFVRWLHEGGVQFAYAALDPARPVPPECFWTSNVSVKRDFVLDAGGFDERFTDAACEDAELGLRLARRGLRLRYDPEAGAEHFHPTDLERTLERMRRIGITYRTLVALAPEMPEPRPPGLRHRVKALVLTALMGAGVRTSAVRHASWRFLCDEVQRETYWDSGGSPPEIGRRLARIALADPVARPDV